MSNKILILISGESGTGKSASLMNLRNQEKWLYLNCEVNKPLPFRNKFQSKNIQDPLQVLEAFDYATKHEDKFEGIIIDTITFMMDMYESMHILPLTNKMDGWSNYQQFFKELMQEKVKAYSKPVLLLGHTRVDYDEVNMMNRASVPVKGALKNNGVESFFSTVVSTKTISLKNLEKYKNDMLHITEQDEILGYKHVFQTQKTKETVGDRIRSPIGLFTTAETFIDNDAQMLIDHMNKYYA